MIIAIEGGDGTGKTTLCQTISHWLNQKNIPHILTKEPGSSQVGRDIKEIIMKHEMDPITEFLLFEADRREHVKEIIEPALKEGKLVLCDRYHMSTIAYQIHGRGIGQIFKRVSNTLCTHLPSFTILLDGDLEKCNARQSWRDRIGGESLHYHARVREGFLAEMGEVLRRLEGVVINVDSIGAQGVADIAIKSLERYLHPPGVGNG